MEEEGGAMGEVRHREGAEASEEREAGAVGFVKGDQKEGARARGAAAAGREESGGRMKDAKARREQSGRKASKRERIV